MKIKDLPRQNRPRERFLKYGPETLSDAELFAIILRTGTINENVVDVSNRLIKEYGLDKLFECSLKELEKIKGIGPSKAMQILAMAELGKRHTSSKTPIKKITCAEDVFNHFHERLKNKKQLRRMNLRPFTPSIQQKCLQKSRTKPHGHNNNNNNNKSSSFFSQQYQPSKRHHQMREK